MGRGAGSVAEQSAPTRASVRGADPGVGYLGTFNFGSEQIARGWHLSVPEILSDYGGNARHSSRMIERRIARSLGGQLAPEGASHDVRLTDGMRLEVRCFTRGVSFAPSHSVGAGRRVTLDAINNKFLDVDAFVVCDVSGFPRVESWLVLVETVADWMMDGVLGVNGRMTAAKFRRLASEAPPAQLAPSVRRRVARQATVDSDSPLRAYISLEAGRTTALDHKVGGPVASEALVALARIKTSASLDSLGFREPSNRNITAATLLLDALVTPETLALARKSLSPDAVQFFQLERVEDGESVVLLDIGPECNLLDLVARYAVADDREPLALAFADALADGWVAASSSEGRAAGYAEDAII
jgi:hypothetical protein